MLLLLLLLQGLHTSDTSTKLFFSVYSAMQVSDDQGEHALAQPRLKSWRKIS